MDLRKEIEHLRALTPELNAVTDRAAKLVLAVEHFLTDECQLGLSAHTTIYEGDQDGGRTSFGTRLEYARWEGKFRVVVSHFVERDGEEDEISDRMPWANCTRERKLATISLIPSLLESIGKTIQSTITEAKRQSAIVDTYLAELGIKEVK